ncbi:hypothetical protein AB0J71_20005 [Nonomuraea sp. NPDC049637]|uniref:hypothetical protein n=1 Tax=Nonomuraea sp. NPDC049637 TaxID=3154356 RepID=UPI0034236FCD
MSWRAVVTLLIAVALTGGCGGGDGGQDGSGAGEAGPGAPQQARPVITPDAPIVPDDAGDLPDPTAQVGVDCQQVLNNRDFAGPAAQKIDQVAADPGSSDSEKAVANACGAVIKANSGKWDESIKQAHTANSLRESVPQQMRTQLFAMVDQAELESAAALGDSDRVRQIIARIEREGGQVPDKYLRNACAVVSGTQTLPECATLTASPGSSQPSSQPSSGTSSESTSGPSEPAGPSPGEPPSEAPGTEPPGEPPDTGGETGPPGGNPEPPPEDTGPAPAPS